MINQPDFVKKAIEKLNADGFEAYEVGGCVRDSLMGRKPYDWDITTSASPIETKAVFEGYKVVETGIKHGTVTVIIDGHHLEITTYRIDGGYTDNRHPDKVSFTKKLSEDLSRRDFTINAIAFHAEKGIYDCFDGVSDIKNRIIRCVGEPDRRFSEDALRIMRALRFASVLGFEIEEETEKSIRKNAHLLKNIAAERISVELSKLLCGKNVYKVLMSFPDVLEEIIPEIGNTVGFDQKTKYHIFDVYEHILKSTENIKPVLHLRLAMLFHDIGKPHCFTIDENGQGHFKGHAKISYEIAEKSLGALKYDNVTKEKVLTLIKYHDAVIEDDERLIKRWLNRLTPEVFFDLMEVKKADTLSQNPEFDRTCMIEAVSKKATEILERKECFSLSALAVKGDDLLALGVPEGKKIGKALEFLLKAVTDGKCENDKQKLINFWQKQ